MLARGKETAGKPQRQLPPPGELLTTGTRLLLPLILLFGAYVFSHGHLTPGGGFQGGAILASAMLLLLLSNPARRFSHRLITLVESTAGISFVFIGILGILLAGGFLDNRILPVGTFGELFSAGAIPIIIFFVRLGLTAGPDERPGLLALLQVGTDTDTTQTVLTDASWKAANSEQEGGEQPDFDDAAWVAAKELGLSGMEPWKETRVEGERVLPARMQPGEIHAGRQPST